MNEATFRDLLESRTPAIDEFVTFRRVAQIDGVFCAVDRVWLSEIDD